MRGLGWAVCAVVIVGVVTAGVWFHVARSRSTVRATTTQPRSSPPGSGATATTAQSVTALPGPVIYWANATLMKQELDSTVSAAAFPGFEGTVAVDTLVTSVPGALARVRFAGPECPKDYGKTVTWTSRIVRVQGEVACDAAGVACMLRGRGGKLFALRETLVMHSQVQAAERLKLTLPVEGALSQRERASRLLVLLGPWGDSWQHFLQDLVDMAGTVWDELEADPGLRLLMMRPRHKQSEELMALLGLLPRIAALDHPSNRRFIAAGGLVFVNKEVRLPGSEPHGLQRVRSELVRRAGCVAGSKRTKIFLWHRNSGTRMLQNAGEAEAALRRWAARAFGGRFAVEVYDPSTLPLRESVLRMCACAAVLHMHGGLLYHAIGMPDESAVVEMLPRQGMCTAGVHFNLALRHQWWGLGVAGHRDQQWSAVAISELESVLEEVRVYLLSRSWY